MRIRLKATEVEGLKALAAGYEALNAGDYTKAEELFVQALAKIPVRTATDEARKKAEFGEAEAAFRKAQAEYEKLSFAREAWPDTQKSIAEAQRNLATALKDEKGHGEMARELNKRITAAEERLKELIARPVKERNKEEFLTKAVSIEEMISQGRQLFEIEEYDKAEALFEQVLRTDPYSKDAMKFLKRIEDRRLSISNLRREGTRVAMIQDVRERWNPPLRSRMAQPVTPTPGKPETTPSTRMLQEKMQSIIIPSIEFRQANIVDVIGFLRDASEAADPDKRGVNIILKLDVGAGGAATATPTEMMPPVAPTTDPFALPPATGDSGALAIPSAPDIGLTPPATGFDTGGSASIPLITLNLKRVTLLDAIRYVTEVANLKYRIEENAVVITPANYVSGNIVTRLYPVMPSIIDVTTAKVTEPVTTSTRTGGSGGEFIRMEGSGTEISREKDIKKFFETMGVPFPTGTSISYNPTISQLIVRNTAENLEIFERILAQLNVVPNQVEIEARFVEIAQNELAELGFEWLLTDSWEIANKKGEGMLVGKERIQMNANSAAGGFTHGMRYFVDNSGEPTPSARSTLTGASMLGNLLSVSSILTNPEVTMILHAMDQKGAIDVLSSPRVTTRSGVNAIIKVVEEIIYPTEFESQQVGDTIASWGMAPTPGQTQQTMYDTRPPVPGSFETREVGVILNVTPVVGPDGMTVDLTLVPEVAELVRWIDYGPNGLYPILQPVFASRNVTTSIMIWDGQTVVMGGLIREASNTIDDRIPVLGDIPLIGNLFKNKGEYSRKQNLMIFVTARLVDPAGNTIRQSTATPTGTAGGTAVPPTVP